MSLSRTPRSLVSASSGTSSHPLHGVPPSSRFKRGEKLGRMAVNPSSPASSLVEHRAEPTEALPISLFASTSSRKEPVGVGGPTQSRLVRKRGAGSSRVNTKPFQPAAAAPYFFSPDAVPSPIWLHPPRSSSVCGSFTARTSTSSPRALRTIYQWPSAQVRGAWLRHIRRGDHTHLPKSQFPVLPSPENHQPHNDDAFGPANTFKSSSARSHLSSRASSRAHSRAASRANNTSPSIKIPSPVANSSSSAPGSGEDHFTKLLQKFGSKRNWWPMKELDELAKSPRRPTFTPTSWRTNKKHPPKPEQNLQPSTAPVPRAGSVPEIREKQRSQTEAQPRVLESRAGCRSEMGERIDQGQTQCQTQTHRIAGRDFEDNQETRLDSTPPKSENAVHIEKQDSGPNSLKAAAHAQTLRPSSRRGVPSNPVNKQQTHAQAPPELEIQEEASSQLENPDQHGISAQTRDKETSDKEIATASPPHAMRSRSSPPSAPASAPFGYQQHVDRMGGSRAASRLKSRPHSRVSAQPQSGTALEAEGGQKADDVAPPSTQKCVCSDVVLRASGRCLCGSDIPVVDVYDMQDFTVVRLNPQQEVEPSQKKNTPPKGHAPVHRRGLKVKDETGPTLPEDPDIGVWDGTMEAGEDESHIPNSHEWDSQSLFDVQYSKRPSRSSSRTGSRSGSRSSSRRNSGQSEKSKKKGSSSRRSSNAKARTSSTPAPGGVSAQPPADFSEQDHL